MVIGLNALIQVLGVSLFIYPIIWKQGTIKGDDVDTPQRQLVLQHSNKELSAYLADDHIDPLFHHGFSSDQFIHVGLSDRHLKLSPDHLDAMFPTAGFDGQPFMRVWSQSQHCCQDLEDVYGDKGLFRKEEKGGNGRDLMNKYCGRQSIFESWDHLIVSMMCVNHSGPARTHQFCSYTMMLMINARENKVDHFHCGKHKLTINPNDCMPYKVMLKGLCYDIAETMGPERPWPALAFMDDVICFQPFRERWDHRARWGEESIHACFGMRTHLSYWHKTEGSSDPGLRCFPPTTGDLMHPKHRVLSLTGSPCVISRYSVNLQGFHHHQYPCECAARLTKSSLIVHARGTGRKHLSASYLDHHRQMTCDGEECLLKFHHRPDAKEQKLFITCNGKQHNFHLHADRSHHCKGLQWIPNDVMRDHLCRMHTTPKLNTVFWSLVWTSPLWIIGLWVVIMKLMMTSRYWMVCCFTKFCQLGRRWTWMTYTCPDCHDTGPRWMKNQHETNCSDHRCPYCARVTSDLHVPHACKHRIPHLVRLPLHRVTRMLVAWMTTFTVTGVILFTFAVLLVNQPTAVLGDIQHQRLINRLAAHDQSITHLDPNCSLHRFDGSCAPASALYQLAPNAHDLYSYHKWLIRMKNRKFNAVASSSPSWCSQKAASLPRAACIQLGFATPRLSDLSLKSVQSHDPFILHPYTNKDGKTVFSTSGIVDLLLNGPHAIDIQAQTAIGKPGLGIKIVLLKAVKLYRLDYQYMSYPFVVHHSVASHCTGSSKCVPPPQMDQCSVKIYEWDRARNWGCNPSWCLAINEGQDCLYLAAKPSSSGNFMFVHKLHRELLAAHVCIVFQDSLFICQVFTHGSDYKIGPLSLHATLIPNGQGDLDGMMLTSFSPTTQPNHVFHTTTDLRPSDLGHGVLGDLGVPQSKKVRLSRPCWNQKPDHHYLAWPGLGTTHDCQAFNYPIIRVQSVPTSPLAGHHDLFNQSTNLLTRKVKLLNPQWKDHQLEVDGLVEENNDFGMLQLSVHVDGLIGQLQSSTIIISHMKQKKCKGCFACDVGFICIVEVICKGHNSGAVSVRTPTSGVYLEVSSIVLVGGSHDIAIHGKTAYKIQTISLCIHDTCIDLSLNLTQAKMSHYLSYENFNVVGQVDPHCSNCTQGRVMLFWKLLSSLYHLGPNFGSVWQWIITILVVLIILFGLGLVIYLCCICCPRRVPPPVASAPAEVIPLKHLYPGHRFTPGLVD